MSHESLRPLVEQCLEETWGAPVALEPPDGGGLSGRAHVHRLRVRSAPEGAPSSVVVKQPRREEGAAFDPSGDDPATVMFFNEWASLQLLTEVCPDPPAPRLHGGSADRGFLVMEDLGSEPRLDHALRGDDPALATRTLVALSSTVGRMHAATMGRRLRFEEILAEHGRRPPAPDHGAQGRREAAILDALARLELRPDARFFDELAEIGRRVDAPGDFDALVHGDPCPDNCHWVGGRVRLLDFEHGRFGNAFTDGCYPRIHFPTCWCVSRLPDEVVQQAVDAYRRALAPGASDEQAFERGMTDASIQWAWSTFGRWHMPGALEQDREWGLVTVRQRILFRFRLLLDMLDRSGWYPAVAETTRRSLAALSARWHDVAEMPPYPAFR